MPQYFFKVGDNGCEEDAVGVNCANRDEVRKMAMKALPEIAAEGIPADGNQHIFTVVAHDDKGEAVYTATLSFVGMWLNI